MSGIKLGYDLNLEQSQKLTMTPELIQAIKILQLNAQDLEIYVMDQLQSNPVLEPAAHDDPERDANNDEFGAHDEHRETVAEKAEKAAEEREALQDRMDDYCYDDVSYNHKNSVSKEEKFTFEHFATAKTTLRDHLMEQLYCVRMSDSCQKVCKYIIESLDDNGYFTLSDEEIIGTLKISEKTYNKAIDVIQSFEPNGVGARSLQECLIIQLKAMDKYDDLTEHIIQEHLENLASNRLQQIAKSTGESTKRIQEIADVIKCLEPKPGRQFAVSNETEFIIPDVIVEKGQDGYIVSVNDSGVPKLSINSYYRRMMRQDKNDEKLSKYLTEKYNAANWLVKSIEQRKNTIYNVALSVVEHQKEFLDKGEMYLKPMNLREIAEDVGIHESTVSRSINGKYMQTPRGVFPIKYFFASGVSGYGEGGVSSKSVKTMIKELIQSEDTSSPYSDQTIVGILKDKGVEISRRTVAKYRDELQIPSSSRRRRYK